MRTRVLTPQKKTPHTPNPPHCREVGTPLQSGCARWTVPPVAARIPPGLAHIPPSAPSPPSLGKEGPGQLGLVSTILQLPIKMARFLYVPVVGGRYRPSQLVTCTVALELKASPLQRTGPLTG